MSDQLTESAIETFAIKLLQRLGYDHLYAPDIKPMKGHNLMQAIARVNRVYGDKPRGLVVDYLGIAADLAAGIKKPDISILSEEFLLELKGMEHKNIALEVLKKILNDELKARAKKNLVQSKTLLEMLENAIKRYQNKILTAAEIMEELIDISKEIVASDAEAKNMGLSDFEYSIDKLRDSLNYIQQQNYIAKLEEVLTGRERSLEPYWNELSQGISEQLLSAIKIDSCASDLTTFSGSVNNTGLKSWFSMKQYSLQNKNSLTISSPSSIQSRNWSNFIDR